MALTAFLFRAALILAALGAFAAPAAAAEPKEVMRLQFTPCKGKLPAGDFYRCFPHVALDADGKRLAVASVGTEGVGVFAIDDARRLWWNPLPQVWGSLAFNENGRWLIVGRGDHEQKLRVLDANDGRVLAAGGDFPIISHLSPVDELTGGLWTYSHEWVPFSFLPVPTGAGETSPKPPRCSRPARPANKPPTPIAATPDGKVLCAVLYLRTDLSLEGERTLWSQPFDCFLGANFTGDGRLVAFTCGAGNQVELRSAADGRRLSEPVNCYRPSFSQRPVGSTVLCSSGELFNGLLLDVATGRTVFSLRPSPRINQLTWSWSRSHVAYLDARKTRTIVLQTEDGDIVDTKRETREEPVDTTLRVFRSADGQEVLTAPLGLLSWKSGGLRLSLAGNGSRAAVLTPDGLLRVWDVPGAGAAARP